MEENLDLLTFYANYIPGMTDGMNGALVLGSLKSAFEIEGVPQKLWPFLTKRILRLHSIVMKHQKTSTKKA